MCQDFIHFKLVCFQTVLHTGTGTDQNFIIGCWCSLESADYRYIQTNTLLYVAGIFPVIFLFPRDIVAICLCPPTYRVMMVQYLSVFRFVGTYSCCCVLNPKSTKGATHFLVWWGITISPTCVHISVRIFGWMVRSLDWWVHYRSCYQCEIHKY